MGMPNMTTSQSFDRVRPRSVDPKQVADRSTTIDREGKRALFSDVTTPPAAGSVSVFCRRCDAKTVLPMGRALRVALPSLPVMVPGRGLRLNSKCPACGERSWLAVSMLS